MSHHHCAEHGLGRRELLAGAAALGALSLGGNSQAAETSAPGTKPHRIDIHHHFMTPRFVEEVRDRFLLEVNSMEKAVGPVLNATLTDSLAKMDQAGVATAMLSLSNPGPWMEGDLDATHALTRHCNDFAAKAQADHPGRFGHFASLPLPDIEGSLREVAYALDTLKADGFQLLTNYGDKWLGHETFWPLYEELDRRKAVLFVHPATPGCCQRMDMHAPPALLEYPFDTTRAITDLIYSGVATRFPNIRFIFCHGGGATFMMLDRFPIIGKVRPDFGANAPQGALELIKNFYFDTASVYNPAGIAALRAALPLSQILFGSDEPYNPLGRAAAMLGQLVPESDARLAIERGNALALLPQLASMS